MGVQASDSIQRARTASRTHHTNGQRKKEEDGGVNTRDRIEGRRRADGKKAGSRKKGVETGREGFFLEPIRGSLIDE